MSRGRYLFIITLLLGLLAFIGGRLVQLHVVKHEFLQAQGDARTMRVVTVPAYRGMITDRNGEPLAVSTPVQSVWVNPQEFELTDYDATDIQDICDKLNISPAWLSKKLAAYKGLDKEFLYLQRHIDAKSAAWIKNLALPGLYLSSEYRRYYPAGDVSAHVVGFTDIDDKGQEGLELAYESWLQGQAGKKRIIRDCTGREVEYIEELHAMQSGRNIALSIDQRLQYIAHRALADAVSQHKAISGSVVVLSVATGEVLAMANQPTFNPNARIKIVDNSYRNRAVTDYFEPASAIKAFSLASVLENTDTTAETVVDTSPGYFSVQGGVVRDLTNNGVINVATILKRSSNIGISKLVLGLPVNALWNMYSRLGFGFATGSGFPGESEGVLRYPTTGNQRPFALATMSFGYGLAVTPLQLARAYAILGAGGVKRPLSFTKVTEAPTGVRVMSEHVAREVVRILSLVVDSSKSKAGIPGYRVAGKTGTARKLDSSGYYVAQRHRAIFGGLAPAINPRFAIVVIINEPRAGNYYSNQVSAPVFSKVAAGAFRLFNIAPDVIDTQGMRVAQNGNNHS